MREVLMNILLRNCLGNGSVISKCLCQIVDLVIKGLYNVV